MIKIYEGRVNFVAPARSGKVNVTGIIKAVDPPSREVRPLDFYLHEVDAADRHLVIEGRRFYCMVDEDTGRNVITIIRPRPTVISVGTAHEHSTAEPT